MKKRSTWIVCLCALLCLTMLLVSCNNAGGPTDETAPQETEAPGTKRTPPTDEKVNYGAVAEEWSKYLSAKPVPAKDYEQVLKLTMNASDYPDTVYDQIGRMEHGYLIEQSARYDYTSYSVRRTVYNMKTGEQVFYGLCDNFTVYVLDFLHENYVYSGIFEVMQGNRVEEEWTYTYSYYDANGELLQTGDERPEIEVSFVQDSYTQLVTIGDDCYICRYGEIIYTCKKGSERVIPYFNECYNGVYYQWDDDEIFLYDKDFRTIVWYPISDAHDLAQRWRLGNGDILIQYQDFLPDDATLFDYSDMLGNKFNVSHVLISAQTGKISELQLDFVISSMITNGEESELGLTMNGEYQLVTCDKISNRRLSATRSFLVMDHEMKTVADLPLFLKNQVGVWQALDENRMLIELWAVDTSLFYSVDLTDGSHELYVNVYALTDYGDNAYYELDGGFIYRDALYNHDCEKLYDFQDITNYGGFTRLDGSVWLLDEDTMSYKVCSVVDGRLNSKTLSYLESEFFTDLQTSIGIEFMKKTDSVTGMEALYNSQGELLAIGESLIIDIFEDTVCIIATTDGMETYYVLK